MQVRSKYSYVYNNTVKPYLRLMSHAMFICINQTVIWNAPIVVTADTLSEIVLLGNK